MSAEVMVGLVEAIPAGEGRNFEVSGERVAVFHTRTGQVFATQAECPHKGGPLADGLLGGTTLVCPLHAWKFELGSGEPLLGACAIKTYPTRLDESGRVFVTV
jgi:nitrite reductase (NADH) small subunit